MNRRSALAVSSASSLTPNHRRVLEAIDHLPDDEREVFGLVRVQGLTHPEAAEVTGVSIKTVQRRLNRAMVLLWKELEHLRPTETRDDVEDMEDIEVVRLRGAARDGR